jgi:hypothetical protein
VISLDSAREPAVVQCDPLIYSSGINPVESHEPRPRQTPIIIAKSEKTHEETAPCIETQKQNALRAPARDPCQAWPSSWAAGLKEELANGKRLESEERTLVNVGEDTTLGDGDVSEKLVQLLVVADGELEMAGDDTGLLVVAGSVSGQLEDLSRQVLEDGSEVDGCTGTDTLGVVALAEQTVDTADGERETSLG